MFPSAAAIGGILSRNGLVQRRRKRRRYEPTPTTLRRATAPNDVWCIDYKGQFRLGDGTYCYPLTVTDQFSRYILGCEGMAAISDEQAREACQEIFRRYGLPNAMRSDNGVPFSSTGLRGLTKLSVMWLRLGIVLERIRPAHPEENGQHERMHRTLKFETTRPSRTNLLQQQERFDQFVEEFNTARPHEALDMKRPIQVYTPSVRPLPAKLPEPSYHEFDDVLRVNRGGQDLHPGHRPIHALSGAGWRARRHSGRTRRPLARLFLRPRPGIRRAQQENLHPAQRLIPSGGLTDVTHVPCLKRHPCSWLHPDADEHGLRAAQFSEAPPRPCVHRSAKLRAAFSGVAGHRGGDGCRAGHRPNPAPGWRGLAGGAREDRCASTNTRPRHRDRPT